MRSVAYPVRAKVWLYQGDPSTSSRQASPWHFITIQKMDADEIKKEYIGTRGRFFFKHDFGNSYFSFLSYSQSFFSFNESSPQQAAGKYPKRYYKNQIYTYVN